MSCRLKHRGFFGHDCADLSHWTRVPPAAELRVSPHFVASDVISETEIGESRDRGLSARKRHLIVLLGGTPSVLLGSSACGLAIVRIPAGPEDRSQSEVAVRRRPMSSTASTMPSTSATVVRGLM